MRRKKPEIRRRSSRARSRGSGTTSLRPGQAEVIADIFAGRPVIAVMPTGAGKSLCYQLPAVVLGERGGVTLVVSPLIALMKDQVDALTARGVPAVALTSRGGRRRAARDPRRASAPGMYTLVYVAPERFRSPRFVEALRAIAGRLALSRSTRRTASRSGATTSGPTTGGSARSSQQLGAPRLAAFTATATPEVRARHRAPARHRAARALHVRGFDRPNLHYAVAQGGRRRRTRRPARRARAHARGRRRAGLRGDAQERRGVRRRAASAAGMRVARLSRRPRGRRAREGAGRVHGRPARRDRRDQRVRHGRRQERHPAGRPRRHPAQPRGVLPGGRPRRPRRQAHALRAAVQPQRHPAAGVPDRRVVSVGRGAARAVEAAARPAGARRAHAVRRRARGAAASRSLGRTTSRRDDRRGDAHPRAPRHAAPRRRAARRRRVPSRATFPPLDVESLQRRAEVERSKLRTMVEYAYYPRCRRQFVLEYFGDQDWANRDRTCGACDNCEAIAHGRTDRAVGRRAAGDPQPAAARRRARRPVRPHADRRRSPTAPRTMPRFDELPERGCLRGWTRAAGARSAPRARGRRPARGVARRVPDDHAPRARATRSPSARSI